MIRLFVGLEMPEAVRDALSRLTGGLPGARWVPPENYHLTLRFIGEVDEGVAQDIDEALDLVVAPAFTLALDGLGQFGKGEKSRVLWAGVRAEPALDHLQAKVESAVVRAGLAAETRKFSPHVTLATLGRETPASRVGRLMEEHGLFQAGPFPVDRFVLYESVLGRQGSTYHAVRHYPLGGWRPAEEAP
ncbi:RNA 2',3'-cyclic phosphodiesterase [Nitrospirillum sp. BR 11164]|uniref:RNA 2',3'-cyclic phosphodiesterase n=1 Tax=Nitrospirillum sp. BR 11164 TaxID=3104324 RepID=UPI002AFF20CA|nr:RNA 2',3'-cyclic phosphodiesterase [Nitrospirillum sp. BR 11164]MEA1649731.1 RNA 2',3'-cyclic phosphodiesterase [Nitrospirillum sp. BR 11164]